MPGTRDAPFPRDWFERAFGIEEEQVTANNFVDDLGKDRKRKQFVRTRSNFSVDGDMLTSRANGRRFHVGPFETPTLRELRVRCAKAEGEAPPSFLSAGGLAFVNVVSDTPSLHLDPANAGAVFQASSLFNCLETSPMGIQPADGVTSYANQAAQGPACALSCPAATVYRNYFAHEAYDEGVNCLSGIEELLDNEREGYWTLSSGHCVPKKPESMKKLSKRLANDASLAEAVCSSLKVGIHWETEVEESEHRVCQVFTSALPVGLVKTVRSSDWRAFASLLLAAAYDATLSAAALLAATRGTRVTVFLTELGGGCLGNRQPWIAEALERALVRHERQPLDVRLVHFFEPPRSSLFAALEEGRAPRLPSETLASQPAAAGAGASLTEFKRELQEIRSKAAKGAGGVDLSSLRASFEKFDEDGNGKLDMAELSTAEDFVNTQGKLIARTFTSFDANGDGVVDRTEFVKILSLADPEFFTPNVARILLEEADADGDGVVHYIEFCAWIFAEEPEVVGGVLNFAEAISAS